MKEKNAQTCKTLLQNKFLANHHFITFTDKNFCHAKKGKNKIIQKSEANRAFEEA